MLPPRALIDELEYAGLAGGDVFSAARPSTEIPDAPGAYLLLIGLKRPIVLKTARFAGVALPTGWYVYAGSAYGPGGMRGRVARHLRRKKPIHWHVDHLTCDATVTAMCYSGADECRLVETLIAANGFTVPAPGFGSTDCKSCDSHLVRWTTQLPHRPAPG